MKLLRGTSIIEVIVATALISVAIIAALSLVNSSQKQNTYAKDLAEATKYSTQGADWIRSQRDFLGFASLNAKNIGDYCLNIIPSDFNALPAAGACTDSITGTHFQRKISLTKPDASTLRIIIETAWPDKIPRKATIEMELTKW